MKNNYLIPVIVLSLLSCEHKDKAIKQYKMSISVESNELTLYPENTFKLAIHTDYYSRESKGKYLIKDDTLVLNPTDRQSNPVDSIICINDASIIGERIIQLFKRNFTYGFGKVQSDVISVGSFYSESIYINNDTAKLEIRLDSTSLASIPDSITIHQIRYRPINENNCQHTIEFIHKVTNPKANLIKVYLNSSEDETHYLQNWKWLIKGDTIFPYYTNGCNPNRRAYLLLNKNKPV